MPQHLSSPFRTSTPGLPYLFLLSFLLLAGTGARAQFTTGNVVVLQSGDGSAALSAASTPVFLKEYNTSTAAQLSPVTTVTVPVTGTNKLTINGSSSSEGFMTLSSDSSRLVLAGYDTTVGVPAINGTTSALVNRVIDTLSVLGIPGRAALTNTYYNTNNFRCATRNNGENYWGSGSSGGTYYFGTAAAASVVQTTVTNDRVVQALNGNLYFSTGSGTLGIYKITGQPTSTATATSFIATASSGTGTASPYGFSINTAETIAYIADDRTAATGGGVQKWTYSASAWTLSYILPVGGTAGARGLAVDWSGPYPSLYATTSDSRLVKIIDTNSSVTAVTLATAGTNTAFRSVAFAPKSGCVVPTLTATPTNVTCTTTGSITLTATGGSSPYTYSWTGPGTFTATTQNISGLAAGTYNVTVTATGGCTAATSATITNTGSLTATITPAGPTTFCAGVNVFLNANTGTGYTYQWKLNGTNAPGTTATSASYYAYMTGNYTVDITSGTCTATSAPVTVTVNPVFIGGLAAGGPVVFCAGGSVVLATTPGGSHLYQWKLNGVDILGATAYSYSATATGSYSLIVSNANGTCPNSAGSIQVTVNPLPTISISPATPAVCSGQSIALTASGAGTGSYSWSPAASLLTSTGATVTTTNLTVNTTYIVTGTDANGCVNTATKTVTINAAPTAAITASGPLNFCAGNTVLLTGSTGTGYTYQWKLNGTAITGATNSTYNAGVAGSYTLTVNNGGCSATSAAVIVGVNPTPSAAVSVNGPTTFCQGDTVKLTATTPGTNIYQWLRNGLVIPGATTNTYSALNTGPYRVIVTNAGGCFDTSAAINVTVNPLPVATVAVSGPLAFCANDSVTLIASGSSGYTFQWRQNGSAIPGATASSFTIHNSGAYSVRLTTVNGCTDSSVTYTATVRPLPLPVVTYTGGLLGTGAFSGYQWNFNGLPVSGATSASHQPDANGLYTVTVTDTNGCSNTSAPFTVTGLGVGHTPQQQAIQIYPNPAQQMLHIKAGMPVLVMIKDIQGRIVLRGNAPGSINISLLAPGIYQVIVRSTDGALLLTQRLVKSGS